MALAVSIAGVVAAVLVPRSVVRAIDQIVAAADRFDLTSDPSPVPPRGGPELEMLAERFNKMMWRLRSAFEEQERAKQKAFATERLAALGSLVAGVSHEVNNPLAGLKNVDGVAVNADRRQMGQALLNLVLNAAYVTPGGGRITVQLRRRAGQVGIAVADAGPGIPEGIRDRILDPFFSTKPEGEGTGLGLSVTRAIVDSHHGELEFECPAEGGTVATIWLPEAKPEADQKAS